MDSLSDSYWAGLLQSKVNVAAAKTFDFGSKHPGLLQGFQKKYGGSLKKVKGRVILVFRGELKKALIHRLEPFLDGKVDETEWVRGYIAGGVYVGKRELVLRRTQERDLIKRLKTVLLTEFPSMQVRGGEDFVGIYQADERVKVLEWTGLAGLTEEEELKIEDANARAAAASLQLVNMFRYERNIEQKYPRLSSKMKDNLILDLQRTHPILQYKYLSNKYGYSPTQIAYLVREERRKGTVFPMRRAQGEIDQHIQDYIQNQYQKVILNPRNAEKGHPSYAKSIRDKIKIDFGIDVKISAIQRTVRQSVVRDEEVIEYE